MKHGNTKKGGKLPIFRDRFRLLQGDMSVTSFAEKLGLTRQTVGFYLNGDRIPDALTLAEIAKKCGVSSDWVLGISNTRSCEDGVKSIVENTGLSESSAEALFLAKKTLSPQTDPKKINKFRECYNIPDSIDIKSLFMTGLAIPDFIDAVMTAITANDTLLPQITTAFNLWFSSFPEVKFDEVSIDEGVAFINRDRIAIDRKDFIKLCTYEIANSVANALSQHYLENYDKELNHGTHREEHP